MIIISGKIKRALNVVVERLRLLLSIGKFRDSNLGTETGYPD
jgi:hypothetical protein